MEGINGILVQRNFFPFAERHAIVDISHRRKFNHSVQNLGFGMSEFWLFVLSCTPSTPSHVIWQQYCGLPFSALMSPA